MQMVMAGFMFNDANERWSWFLVDKGINPRYSPFLRDNDLRWNTDVWYT